MSILWVYISVDLIIYYYAFYAYMCLYDIGLQTWWFMNLIAGKNTNTYKNRLPDIEMYVDIKIKQR